jgi:hypothetical protein
MSSGRSGLGRYRIVYAGVVLVLGGVAALGMFLVAAGNGSVAGALTLGLVALACLAGGATLVRVSARRRGGVLSADPTSAQRRRYRRTYRGPYRSAH